MFYIKCYFCGSHNKSASDYGVSCINCNLITNNHRNCTYLFKEGTLNEIVFHEKIDNFVYEVIMKLNSKEIKILVSPYIKRLAFKEYSVLGLKIIKVFKFELNSSINLDMVHDYIKKCEIKMLLT